MDQKRFFLGLSAVFLGLAWIVDAEASTPPDIVNCNAGWGNGCTYLSTDGNVVHTTGIVANLSNGADSYLPLYGTDAFSVFSAENKIVTPASWGNKTFYGKFFENDSNRLFFLS